MSKPATLRLLKKKEVRDFAEWPIGDLRLLKTEPRVGEDGREYFMIFSKKLDAVTAIGAEELAILRARGLKEISDPKK